ncbi:Uncharacterized protein Rs2_46090 [Raphanus sativus]|uniref:Uncharacterized protein At3g28850-like n=1 Tax=Raphanus sativus TaxID=3726 RepID=A0A6J0JU40_RAPSA|nr:uncharacterized protein At3g28850-like [Raphanus sativus]KAJ4872248.1 Uncharacterized protein Rs2_46090 [Raphanus sativus]
MGCASSKHRKRCLHCRQGYSPVDTPSSNSVHRPPQQSEDMVALGSSTLGSLKLCYSSFGHSRIHLADITGKLVADQSGENRQEDGDKEKQAKLMEAKVWSSMMNEKIPKIVPKTPILTPPGEPETINTWEMMDGLEDSISSLPSPNHVRSFSFDVARHGDCERPKENGNVILYFTSLRGVRKTYEESCDVRIILKSLGVRVDERDVSMHSSYKDELKELLEGKFNNGVGITLPRVFLGRKYLGGAEEIRKLNEDGKLEKVLEGCDRVEENKNGNGKECEACGDIRFVPCERCSGSCKVYNEDGESVKEDREHGFQTCPDCNENGLVRCPVCCD